jgi:hypothetical protein
VRAQVPWGAPTVALGLGGWAASFLLTGLLVVPLLAAVQGISLRDLAAAQQTEYILAVQAWETAQGIAIIWACVRGYQPLSPDLFRIDGCAQGPFTARAAPGPSHAAPARRTSSKPFSPENGWAVWGFIGYGATFVAIAAAAASASLLAGDAVAPAGNGTVDAIVPLVRAQDTCCRACGASDAAPRRLAQTRQALCRSWQSRPWCGSPARPASPLPRH